MGIVMIKKISTVSLLSMALMAGTSQMAHAVEATQFADRLVEAGTFMGINFTYGSATAEGDTITLSGFTITVPGEDDVEIDGDVVFEGVAETAEGAYTAQRATIADFEHADDDEDLLITINNIVAEGIELPADISLDTVVELSFGLYDRIAVGPLTISDTSRGEPIEVFAIDLMEVTIDEPAADGGLSSRFAVTGISADLSEVDDVEAQAVIDAFGIETFTGSMNFVGTWWPETGVAELADMSFTIDNLASFAMAVTVDGYTEALYRDLMEMNIKMAEMSEAGVEIDDEQMEAMSYAMLETMGDFRLVDGSIRYDDASLFMKVLDFVGAEQGVDGETFKAGLQFMVPMALADVQNEAFKSMVTNAVNTFIADPQNFIIAVNPDEPIAFSEFEAMADEIEADPFVLVETLNLTISANQ